MTQLQLLPIDDADEGLLRDLQPVVEEMSGVPSRILPVRLDPEFALHGERGQYHSSQILQRMHGFLSAESWRLLGLRR